LFAQDVCGAPLTARDGSIAVRRGVPDADRLRELAAPAGRETWWRERLARGHALLAGVPHE
jgi:O-succinylbenzoate synthase